MREPETRPSLLVRLCNPQDHEAWARFVSIYEPLLLRLMHQRGLQDADARDVTQQVILAVTQAVERWQPDGQHASFRRWLFAIARKLALKFLQRGAHARGPARRGTGGTDMLEILHSLPEPDQRTVMAFDEEYRNEIFDRAAEQVRHEFRDTTWQAFWQTCVLGKPIAEVASQLGLSAGNVYVARTRVIARLRKAVEEYDVDRNLDERARK